MTSSLLPTLLAGQMSHSVALSKSEMCARPGLVSGVQLLTQAKAALGAACSAAKQAIVGNAQMPLVMSSGASFATSRWQ